MTTNDNKGHDPRPEPPPWEDFHAEITATLNGKHVRLDDLPLIRGGAKGDGQIKPLMANVATLLRAEQRFFNLRFDDFSCRPYRGDAKLTDDDFLDITNWTQRAGIHADVRTVMQAVTLVSQDVRFHQVRDYLDALEWDGVPRIDRILVDHGGADDTPIVHAMTAKWMIQAVARVKRPGCQADSMLIAEGEQGRGKSSLFEVLGGPFYVSGLSDMQSKDAKQELRGVWIVELAELDNMHKKEASQIKAFLTNRSDHYRESYGRLANDFPRQCVFAGTVNPDGLGYLKDATGGRRFWPVTVRHTISADLIRANRDQFWAEATHRFEAGEAWYLDDDTLAAEARKVQADRYEGDPWDEIIAEYLVGRTAVTTNEIMENALKLEPARRGKAEEMRVGKVLVSSRWAKHRSTYNGKNQRHYRLKSADEA